MTLRSMAQILGELVVKEDIDAKHEGAPSNEVVFYSEKPSKDVVMNMHENQKVIADLPEVTEDSDMIYSDEDAEKEADIVVISPNEDVHIDIILGDLPGVDHLDEEKEKTLEVEESTENDRKESESSEKTKKSEKWDWESRGLENFVSWVKERVSDVPKHSGYDAAGIDRAISYLEKLDSEISRAMRFDFDGLIDANDIEEIRSHIEDGIQKLNARFEKIGNKYKKKKRASEEHLFFVKNGQKIPGINGIVVTVPLFISRIARTCINGRISAGHDIEYIFNEQCKKYKLNDREKAEVMQLMSDMGYPLMQDRGFMLDEDVDERSSDNFDWSAQYDG